MVDSVFNPDAFLQTQIDAELDTKIAPVPEGDRPGQIKGLKFRSGTDKNGHPFHVMDVIWHILDEESKKATNLPEPTSRQSIYLDITEAGALDVSKGKNVGLGALREAVGQNKAGKPWAPQMLIAQMATCKIKHTANPEDPLNPYSNVVKVTKSA
jgi:hypothetical protein